MKASGLLMALCLIVSQTWAANSEKLTVTGTVTDENNQVLVGVSVSEKGSSNSTFTDMYGKYKIETTKGKTLVFSYIGCITQKIKITGSVLNVKLAENEQTLEEMVVIGYGVQDKCVMVGASPKMNTMVSGVMVNHTNNYPVNRHVYLQDTDNEEYTSMKENRFISVSSEALSTFSLDVDAASYSNVRRMINQGQMPNKEAVRIEEMMNYFSYNYPEPTANHPVNMVAETAQCPWNNKHLLVRIGVKAKEIPSDELPAANLVFLIDVSGSMESANKLGLVKSSMKLLANNLRDKDRVSVVVYAGNAGEVLPSTPGSDRQKIREALDKLTAGGSTAGGAGIELAYKIAEKNLIKGGNNRIILCTDGDFNVGVSSVTELEDLIESKRKTGIYLTALGYGMGNYKDNKLQTLAEKGNGNHAYIDNIQEANKVLVNEFGSTMYTVAKDVKIQVEFNPAYVNAYRLVGYESRLLNKEDFNDDTKDAGELGAGHTVTALYEIIPAGVENKYGGVDKLKYQTTENEKPELKKSISNELLNVKLRYKKPESDTSLKLEMPVVASDVKKTLTGDFSFVAAVAMFGQLLRDSDFKGNASYRQVIDLAKSGMDNDEHGYRREFIRLVEAANQMEK
ncbi:MAG: von Willebrand factor type [Bacteroidetes bacterium]|nr:von Willebrand factor type [Bacteroidota bacterium]